MGGAVDDSTSNLGVNDNNDESVDEIEEEAKPRLNEIDFTLDGPYWSNGTVETKTDLYMLGAITRYNNIDGLHGLCSTPQYGFNRGMKEFGQKGYDATASELSNNLIGIDTVDMLDKSHITSDVYMNALSYLIFLKRKRTDLVKARMCADGRPQREFILKDKSSSPTVSTYALFISYAMNVMEGRQVVTCGIPGTFLQADCPEGNDCYLKFEGLMVGIICDIDPSLRSLSLSTRRPVRRKCMVSSPRQFIERY